MTNFITDTTDTTTLARPANYRIMHVHYEALREFPRLSRSGRGTILYVRVGTRVTVAYSLCSRRDTFKRRTGVDKAVEHFYAGKTFSFNLPSEGMSGFEINHFVLDAFDMAERWGITLPVLPTVDTTSLLVYNHRL